MQTPFLVSRVLSGATLLLAACVPSDSLSDAQRAVTVSPEAVQVLATPDVVTRVVDLQPTNDGRVWVLNSTAPYFVVFGAEGQVERRFGDRGGGPGEFGNPMTFVAGPDADEVWTYDVQRHALIRISDVERRELPLPRDTMPVSSLVSFKGAGINPAAPWFESAGDAFLLARVRASRYESALHLWDADIVRLRGDGSEVSVDLHSPLADFLGDPATRFGDASVLIPYPLWTVCGDGMVALYDPLANTLRRFTEGGEELEAFALPAERRVQMTPDLVFEMFYRQIAGDVPPGQIPDEAEMRRLTEAQNREFVQRSSPFFPEYSDLRCIPDGALWLRLFDATTGRLGWGPDWLRVAANGSRTRVELPRSFRTFRIERDRIWGTVPDALGVESIVWVELSSLRR